MTAKHAGVKQRRSTLTSPTSIAASPPTHNPVNSRSLKDIADSVVQASCIVAVVSLPLYFSLLTGTGYEADKAVLLRALAAVATAAWIIGWMNDSERSSTLLRGGSILMVGLCFYLAYSLATALSIDPRLSLLGSSGRQDGLVTHVAYAVFFLIGATRFRDRRHVERLISALLFGSVPVVIYGLFEQFGFEPIPFVGDPSILQWPVRSSFGQHVFLGSYLVMVIPFTAARLWQSWTHRAETVNTPVSKMNWLSVCIPLLVVMSFLVFMKIGVNHTSLFAWFPAILGGYALLAVVCDSSLSSASPKLRLWCYGVLLSLQMVTLGVTGARGAWLGFLATIPVFGFLVAWRLRKTRVWISVLGFSLAGALFLVVLNIPGGPLQRLRTVHSLARVANITESGGGESGSVQGRMLIWQGVGTLLRSHPSIGTTWGGAGRELVGYGPESMPLAFEKVFPLKLRQATSETWYWDRAHNVYLDYLIDGGVILLLPFLLVVILFFARGLQLIYRAPQATGAVVPIALVAAIVGHLIDGMFGLGMAVNLALFWLFIGLMASLYETPRDVPDVHSPLVNRELPVVMAYCGAVVAGALVLGLVAPAKVPIHPYELAIIWILSVLLAVGSLAAALLPTRVTQERDPRSRKSSASSAAAHRWPRHKVAALGICLVSLVVVADQAQFTRAAYAERSATAIYAMGQTSTAIELLQQASRANPDERSYPAELGLIYRNLAGAVSASSAQPGYRSDRDGFLTIAPDVAITLGRDQLFQLSVLAFGVARSLSPLAPASYENLGETYRQWKQAQPALAQFREAERLSPDNPKYIADEALAEIVAGDVQMAIRRAKSAVRLDDTYWYSHYSLSLAFHADKQRHYAKIEAGTALSRVPVWPQVPPSQMAQLHRLQKTG